MAFRVPPLYRNKTLNILFKTLIFFLNFINKHFEFRADLSILKICNILISN